MSAYQLFKLEISRLHTLYLLFIERHCLLHEVWETYREKNSTSIGKGKDKGHPITGHEGPEGEQMYSSTLPSTSALDGGWVASTTPRPPYHRDRPVTHCLGGWVAFRAGLDECGKFRPHRDSIPGPSSQLRVAIPTELSGPLDQH